MPWNLKLHKVYLKRISGSESDFNKALGLPEWINIGDLHASAFWLASKNLETAYNRDAKEKKSFGFVVHTALAHSWRRVERTIDLSDNGKLE